MRLLSWQVFLIDNPFKGRNKNKKFVFKGLTKNFRIYFGKIDH